MRWALVACVLIYAAAMLVLIGMSLSDRVRRHSQDPAVCWLLLLATPCGLAVLVSRIRVADDLWGSLGVALHTAVLLWTARWSLAAASRLGLVCRLTMHGPYTVHVDVDGEEVHVHVPPLPRGTSVEDLLDTAVRESAEVALPEGSVVTRLGSVCDACKKVM